MYKYMEINNIFSLLLQTLNVPLGMHARTPALRLQSREHAKRTWTYSGPWASEEGHVSWIRWH